MFYVSYKLAVKLKNAGYPQTTCNNWYTSPNRSFSDYCCPKDIELKLAMPTVDEVRQWLIDDKNCFIHIDINKSKMIHNNIDKDGITVKYITEVVPDFRHSSKSYFIGLKDTYIDALTAGIEKALELI